MVRLGFAGLVAAFAMAAGAAQAADQPVYAPPPAWVKPLTLPKGGPTTDTGPTKVLLYEQQSKLTTEEDDYYSESLIQILTPHGLAAVGNLQETWDPATETMVFHKLQILRGDKVIDLLADGKKFTVLRRETNLDSAMLDGRLTASLQPEGLQVGDVIDLAYTLQRRDPARRGYSTDFMYVDHQGIAGRIYFRSFWPTALPIRWKLNEGLKAPVVSKVGDTTELVIDAANVEAPKPPASAPARFGDLGSIAFSQYRDWAELSGLFFPLFDKASQLKPDSPIKREAAKIAALSADPKVRAMMALRLVEDQTRYVFLGMNDGGLVPADAEDTWSRRFGDCKGKTVLLVALLRELGIKADPVFVSTRVGDGMDQRLPSPSWFDHAIVRTSIAGKTYWLDGTRIGDRDLDQLPIPAYGWALPLRVAGAPLEKLSPPPLTEPGYEQAMVIDGSKGMAGVAPAKIAVTYRGELAIAFRASMANASRSDFERSVREYYAKGYSWLDIAGLEIKDDDAAGVIRLNLTATARLDWTDASGGGKIYRVPATSFGGELAKREPGPHADAPFVVNHPTYSNSTWRITLPTGQRYSLFGTDIDRTVAGMALHRRARIDDGVLAVEMSSRSMAPEFPASEAEATATALRELGRSDVAVLATVQTAQAPATTGAATSGGAKTAGPAPASTEATLAADQAAAAKGDARAQLRLAQRYARGDGVPLDIAKGLALLEKAAASGYPAAQVQLGQAYYNGEGVAADKAKAAEWFKKGADGGSADGQRYMAFISQRGEGVPRAPDAAIAWLNKAVAQGDARATAMLAQMYYEPVGVTRDVPKAIALYQKAAAQNNSDAEYALAIAALRGDGLAKSDGIYRYWAVKAAEDGSASAQLALGFDSLNGLNGVTKNPTAAINWMQKAADQGLPGARGALGYIYLTGRGAPKDTPRGLALLTSAAQAGYAPSQADLGFAYLRGTEIPVDTAQALDWLQKSAAQHQPGAALGLAIMYRTGRGVPVDMTKAVGYYREAAEKGQIEAQGALGEMYLNGLGVARDPVQAVVWFQKAADQGNAIAERLLGGMLAFGTGAPKNEPAAAIWWQKASDQGDVIATTLLGIAYIHGSGVPIDMSKAAVLLRKAADAGNGEAQANLGYLYDHGLGVPLDLGQAMAWYRKAADQGNALGEVNLGLMYSQGRNTARNDAQAVALFKKAADQNQRIGQRLLALAYMKGEGVPADKALAKSWLEKAAALGDLDAKRMLGAPMVGAGSAYRPPVQLPSPPAQQGRVGPL